ncbi:MAG: hypothetical protein KGL15_04155 [Acidobacteriota bacterium]|nr:hypothetical protein [Acidobacteriota bacterium]
MRTNDMIYQVAIAHQAELRRTASGRTLKAYGNGGQARRNRLLTLISSRARGKAATRPAGSGIVTRQLPV